MTIKVIVGSQILLRRACLPRLMRSRRPQAGISLITVSTAGITTNSGNISRLRICKGCSLMTPITGSSLRRSTGEARRTRLHTRTMGTGGGLRNRWTAAPTINEADRIGWWGRKGLGQEVSIGMDRLVVHRRYTGRNGGSRGDLGPVICVRFRFHATSCSCLWTLGTVQRRLRWEVIPGTPTARARRGIPPPSGHRSLVRCLKMWPEMTSRLPPARRSLQSANVGIPTPHALPSLANQRQSMAPTVPSFSNF